MIYMAGNKFGTTGREYFTWAMNSYLPGRVAEKFKQSRMVVFSSGNVYPFSPVGSGGVNESVAPEPVGEYAQSCLGRERVFEYFSHQNGTPMAIYRLNYAIDMRYGVLHELARSIHEDRPIHLAMGHANIIWQGMPTRWRCVRSCIAARLPKSLTLPDLRRCRSAGRHRNWRHGWARK